MERHEHVGIARETELLGYDANNGVLMPVHGEFSAENIAAGAETTLPEVVRQNRDLFRACAVIGFIEVATQERGYAEVSKVRMRCDEGLEPFGRKRRGGERGVCCPGAAHRGEGVRVGGP